MARLQFAEEGHRYLLDGIRIPSNTQVLKAEGLVDDAFYTPDGRDRGINVHAGCWFLDEGTLDWETVGADIRGYLKAFERFKAEVEWVTDFNELPVWGSPGFGTRLDLLGVGNFKVGGQFRRRRAVIDLKSGHVPKWVDLQTAGQKLAAEERIVCQDEPWTHYLDYVNGHPYPELRFALQLKKDGTYRLKQFSDPESEAVFRGLVHAYRWKVANGLLKEAA